jgi:hypothetical protein
MSGETRGDGIQEVVSSILIGSADFQPPPQLAVPSVIMGALVEVIARLIRARDSFDTTLKRISVRLSARES